MYADLFSLYQKQQSLGEQYEIVLGQGLLSWAPSEAIEVKRHLMTSRALIEFDRPTGTVRVGPAAEGAANCLEVDMLDPIYLPQPEIQSTLERRVAELEDDVWDAISVDTLLREWVNSVSSDGSFDASLDLPEAARPQPFVRLSPALILRGRGERTFLRFFQEVIGKLEEGSELPDGLKKFLLPAEERPLAEVLDEGIHRDSPEQVLFPLPANSAQLQIVERLGVQDGVVVQGPPGTGKSHTIVNLICHLLAMGQRVLVTSHTARALRVLRGFLQKKVEAVAPLCVLLLSNDRDALGSMEDSVHGIHGKYSFFERQEKRRRIEEIERLLLEGRQQEKRLCLELRRLRERDTFRHPPKFGRYNGTLQEIAEQATEDYARYNWLQDKPSEEVEAPLSNSKALELLILARDRQAHLIARPELECVALEELTAPDVVDALFLEETESQHAFADLALSRSHPAYPSIRNLTAEQRRSLLTELETLLKEFEDLMGQGDEWVRRAAVEVLADHDRLWRDLLTTTRAVLEQLADKPAAADRVRVTGLAGRDLSIARHHATELLEYFRRGGRLRIRMFRSREVKQASYLVDNVHVNGRPCRSAETLATLIDWIDVNQELGALGRLWDPLADFCLTSTIFFSEKSNCR